MWSLCWAGTLTTKLWALTECRARGFLTFWSFGTQFYVSQFIWHILNLACHTHIVFIDLTKFIQMTLLLQGPVHSCDPHEYWQSMGTKNKNFSFNKCSILLLLGKLYNDIKKFEMVEVRGIWLSQIYLYPWHNFRHEMRSLWFHQVPTIWQIPLHTITCTFVWLSHWKWPDILVNINFM